MAYFISLVVFIGSLVLGVSVSAGGSELLVLLIDIPSVVIVLVPAIVFSIATSSWKTFSLSWKLVFVSGAEAAKEEIQEVRAVLNTFGNVSLLMGIIGTLIGLVLMLADLSDPNAIGPNMSVALLTIYYGTFLKFLCYVAERRVNQRLLTNI